MVTLQHDDPLVAPVQRCVEMLFHNVSQSHSTVVSFLDVGLNVALCMTINLDIHGSLDGLLWLKGPSTWLSALPEFRSLPELLNSLRPPEPGLHLSSKALHWTEELLQATYETCRSVDCLSQFLTVPSASIIALAGW